VSSPPTFYFLTPTFKPAGGVIKILDYARYASNLGFRIVICSGDSYSDDLPIFQIERFAQLKPDLGVEYRGLRGFWVGRDDLLFFSWPPHYKLIERRLDGSGSLERIIQIIQNVRHANPEFTGGYATRLLTRPISRIVTNDIVAEAIARYLNKSSLTEVIDLGWDTEYFAKKRPDSPHRPLRIAYTTWKSTLGHQIRHTLVSRSRFHYRFKSIGQVVNWRTLRSLYQWCDVFLSTPSPEEGFYLPGLEAMASGAIVVSPDARGNLVYCEFGKNCVLADYDSVASYVSAVQKVRAMPSSVLAQIRSEGYLTASRYSLMEEEKRFGDYVAKLTARMQALSGAESHQPSV
jgi:hypothetical protein